MDGEGVTLGPKALSQIRQMWRDMTAQIKNPQQNRARWQQQQPRGGCDPSYDLRLLWDPEEAELWIDVKYNDVTERIAIAIDDDETDVKTAIDAHSEFIAAEVECKAESAGGFPHSNIFVTLPPGAKIVDHGATLTQRVGSPSPEFRVDICGCH